MRLRASFLFFHSSPLLCLFVFCSKTSNLCEIRNHCAQRTCMIVYGARLSTMACLRLRWLDNFQVALALVARMN
uniref:Putative secreted protein n=1 Tax=Anopheles darlingi TaxID=43151 RepID=A0A2M4DPN2_ANODA